MVEDLVYRIHSNKPFFPPLQLEVEELVYKHEIALQKWKFWFNLKENSNQTFHY